MDYGDLIKSGIGAVLGFALAQVVDLVRLSVGWWTRPKLIIEAIGKNCEILSHATEVANGELYDETIYGFDVHNRGRRIATGVRIQLIKVEYREESWSEFATISEHAYDLSLYKGAGRVADETVTTLVPGASAVIHLAGWREDYHVIFPAVAGLPDYYEETCALAIEYRFTVVAFDDKARYVRKVLTVRH